MTRRLGSLLAVPLLVLATWGLVSPAGAAPGPHVGIALSSHHVTTQGSVRLEALVRDAPAGATVSVEEQAHGWVVAATWRHITAKQAAGHTFTAIARHLSAGTHRYRMVLIDDGVVIAKSRVGLVDVVAPKPAHHSAPAPAPAAHHACTTTSSGTCIRGGEFCPQASYGQTGWDANGHAWVCTGDRTHPHWE